MKKLLLSLLAAGSLFAANAQTKENPYSVDDYMDACAANALGTEVYVKGYIVGWINGQSIQTGATFTTPATTYSNILIAGSSSETDYTYCVPVQLVSGTDIRAALNLGDNPQNLGHEVIIGGNSEKYFGVNYSIKSPVYYSWVGDAPVATTPDTPDLATGTKEKPLTVAEFIAQGAPASAVANTYLTGVIVGYIPGMNFSEGIFGAEGEDVSNTNLLLAASADVKDLTQCVPVGLAAGVRDGLSLKNVPGNLGKTVVLCGSHEKYFGQNGLKSVSWYELDGQSGGTTPTEPTTGNAIYSGLSANADDWTFEGTVPEGLSYVWSWDASYGLKGSAYYNGCHATDNFMAVSPVIDLTNASDATLAFSQAANKFTGDDSYEKSFFTKVRTEGGAWETITVNTLPAGDNWTFVDSNASLSAYAGKKIQIGFSYNSTDASAGTWEIKNLSVTGTSGVAEIVLGNAVYVVGNNIVAPEGAKVYNLNGVQTGTENLAHGVYVVVCGEKAVKVLVK